MQRSFNESAKQASGHFDNIDLLNLPANLSSESSIRGRDKEEHHRQHRQEVNARGDDYFRHPRQYHQEECTPHRISPSGDNSFQGGRFNRNYRPRCGYSRHNPKQDESLICLYNNNRAFSTETANKPKQVIDEFLVPSYQRKKPAPINKFSYHNVEPAPDRTKQIGDHHKERPFPFKKTSSGNLKIDNDQVVYESNKFSVLVADPQRTQISVKDRRNQANMNKEPEFPNTAAIDTLMKQGIGSSLNSLLVGRFTDAPVRKEKESQEYEGKATHEILDPELNLNRLGYTAGDPIDWIEVSLPEKKNLYLELYARITNFTNADCKVYIDNEEFNCHLLVLQCYSEVFHTYVAVKKVELPSDKCSPASFAFIYEWMITGDPSYKDLNRENVLDIFNAAKYLKIKDLVEQCWAFIDNPEVFSEDTAFLLYIDAKEKNLPEVRELMLPRIEKFFLMLVSSQDWLDLDLEDVQNFLQSNYICVNCEMEVFMSAVRWLKHDWDNRDKYKTAVLSYVRFGNLAPWQLVDIKRNPDNPEFRDLAKDSDICKMIDDGLAFVIIKYWYGQEKEDYQHWNSILALKEPPTRNWSGTEKTYFTYREFLIYLDQYRRNQMIEKSKPREKRNKMVDLKLSPKSSNDKINGKMPTLDEFLCNKRNAIRPSMYLPLPMQRPRQLYRQHLTRRRAVQIIERAYLAYKMRSRVKGLARRLFKNHHHKRRDNQLMRKLFELPRRPPSSTAPLTTKKGSKTPWLKNDPTILRVTVPKDLNFKERDSKASKMRSFGSPSTSSSKKKDYLTETSLFNMEHESVLVFGGINMHTKYGVGKNTGKDIYRYLPINNDWVYVGEMPAPRSHHRVEFLFGRIYVVGGVDPREDDVKGKDDVVDTVWSFEPVKRIWFSEGSLNSRRKNFGLVVSGNYMFAIGGQDKSSRVTDSVERYNPHSSTWDYVASMRHPRMGIACTKFEEKIWVGGGMCGSSQRPLTDSVECYDVENNQWTEVTRLRVPRCFASFFAMSNNLYIIAGAGRNKNAAHNTISFSSIDIWNKEEQTWDEHAEMEVARHGHTTAHLGTQILIIGGVTTVYMRSLSSVECFCTTRGTWIRGMSTLPTCLSGHATVTLPPATLM